MSASPIAAASLSDLVRRWQAGWGLAKGLGPAVEARGGLRVPIGRPDRHVEIIAIDADADLTSGGDVLRGLAAEVTASRFQDWLTVPTTRPDEAEKLLLDAGLELLDRPEWFMAVVLRDHPEAEVPAGFSVTVEVHDSVVEARILEEATGDVAAHGLMALPAGTDAIAHNIATEPAFRRRGLARVVMATLVREAVARGASTGLLVASADGERLYTSLGWVEVGRVLIANRVPEDVPDL